MLGSQARHAGGLERQRRDPHQIPYRSDPSRPRDGRLGSVGVDPVGGPPTGLSSAVGEALVSCIRLAGLSSLAAFYVVVLLRGLRACCFSSLRPVGGIERRDGVSRSSLGFIRAGPSVATGHHLWLRAVGIPF